MPNPWEVSKPQKQANPWEVDSPIGKPLTAGTADQSAGNIPKPSVFLPTREQLPALGGAGLFGLAAGPLGLAAAAGFVGLGAGAGEAAKQMYERGQQSGKVPQYFNEKAPETMGDAAINIGKEGLINAGTELGLGTIGKIARNAGAGQVLENAAESQGRRALGYTKRFLNTAEKKANATQATKVMLDEGVISPGRSASGMAGKVAELQETSGKAIGDFLDSQGMGFDPNSAIQKLETMRPQYKGGHYDQVHNAIDTAIDTIKAHGDKPISWTEANDLKGILQGAAPYEKAGEQTLKGETNRSIAGQFKDYLDSSLDNITGNSKEFRKFVKDKGIYKATKSAEKSLLNRTSSEEGNNLIGLTDIIAGTGGLAGSGLLHSPEMAAGTLGLLLAKKGAERYGPQATAVGLRSLANPSGTLSLMGRAPIRTSLVDYLNNR